MPESAYSLLYDWLMPILKAFSLPFYPAICGLLWCIFRLFKGRHVAGWVTGTLAFIAYFPIVLTAAFIMIERAYDPHDWGTFLVLYMFGLGILVDFVSMPLLILALRRRRDR